jgi:hypothetical protein
VSVGKIAVLAIALVFVSGGVGAALADWNDPSTRGPAIDLVDVDARKDDAVDDVGLVEDDDDSGDAGDGQNERAPQGAAQAGGGDGDETAGNDGTAGGDNTQAAPAPAPAPVAIGDGDVTAGDDGTAGGDNTEAGAAAGAEASEDGAGGDDSGGDT